MPITVTIEIDRTYSKHNDEIEIRVHGTTANAEELIAAVAKAKEQALAAIKKDT